MRLLIVTQKVDRNDPILGFFHRWIEEFGKNYEKIIVICLEKGEYNLPKNVKVLSLGKEEGKSKLEYLLRFCRYIWSERSNYDEVFVHMNQEYVILAGDLWRLLGKKIYLWRNHAHGDMLTRLAVLLSHKVFYTSPQSYTARFKKSVQMPVGIDTDFFRPDPSVSRKKNSILFLGRIGPVKRVVEFIDWLEGLKDEGKVFSATIAGGALTKDVNYEKLVHRKVSEYKLGGQVQFIGSVTQEEALRLYQSHETYVNMTPAGSFDKTILEAASCETSVIVENGDLKGLIGKKGTELRYYVVEKHSLKKLMSNLREQING